MKKFKIYESLKKLYKKRHAKVRFKLYALVTSLTLTTLTSCSTPKQHDNNEVPSTTENIIVYEDYEKYINDKEIGDDIYTTNKMNEETLEILDKEIKFQNIDNIKNRIDNINTEYVYSDIYDVLKAYKRYQKMEIYHGNINDNILNDNKIDANKLYERIKYNNKNYLNSNPYCLYEELDDDKLKYFCNIVVNTINKELETNKFETTFDDLTNNLIDLKMFKSLTMDNAFITDDNVMGISLIAIENMEFVAGNKEADDIVIAHEAEHLLQKLCDKTIKEQGVDYAYGYNVMFKDLEVNSLYHNWFIEAAAENLACEQYNSEPTTYKYKIGYLNTLKLTRILDDNFEVFDLERLTQQQELDKLFEKFNCEHDPEKIELLNMMYAINIIQEEPEDFISIYKQQILKRDNITENDLEVLKIGLKNGVCTTLTKYFYTTMSEKLITNNMKVKDIFSLISMFEAGLSGHISYSGNGNYIKRKQFMENYVDIQDLFYEEMSHVLGVSAKDIELAYQDYNRSIEYNIFDNYADIKISNLSGDKNKFLTKYFKSTIENKVDLSIDEVENKNK